MPFAVLRKPRRAVTAAGIAAVTALTLLTAPSHADHGGASHPRANGNTRQPDSVSAAARRLDRLNQEAEQASERYNTVQAQLLQARGRLSRARAEVARQRQAVAELHRNVAAQALASFEGATLSTTVRLVASEDPDEFLTGLTTVASIAADRGRMLTAYVAERDQLGARRDRLRQQVQAIAEAERQLGVERSALSDKAAEAEALLATLRERQRQARLERQRQARLDARRAAAAAAAAPSRSGTRQPASTPAQPTPAPSSAGGAAAVAFALGQLGDAYVYGGVGPNAWDCSGLTSGAWAAAGVSLPHSASMQAAAGAPVSVSALQPGDLVFYYSPISHVGIYVGDGQLVHAANPSRPVEVVPVGSMPIAMAVRPG